jgi:hypothetical protein
MNPKPLFLTLLFGFVPFLLMYHLLCSPRKRDINLPSTFFTLRQLLSRDWFAGAVLFFCGSLSLVYFSMAIFSNEEISFIDKGMGCAEQSRLCPEVIQSFFEFSASNKSWAGPIVLLIPFVLLFVPPVRFLPSTYRDALISSFGLYTIIDRRALDTAAEYLARHGGDFNSADTALASMYKAAPIPEEYAEHKNVFRLAYQLIWCQ